MSGERFLKQTANHNRSHFARAVLEGTAFALRDARSVIEDIAQNFSEYIFVGGGVRNTLWVSIVADVLEIDGKISTKADTSMGAAIHAGIGTGLFAGVNEAIAKYRTDDEKYIRYDKKNHKMYRALFERYIQMKKIYDRIYKLS